MCVLFYDSYASYVSHPTCDQSESVAVAEAPVFPSCGWILRSRATLCEWVALRAAEACQIISMKRISDLDYRTLREAPFRDACDACDFSFLLLKLLFPPVLDLPCYQVLRLKCHEN